MKKSGISRRSLIQSAAAVGAGMAAASCAKAAAPVATAPATQPKPADINVAIVGFGSQGRNLTIVATKIPGVRFVAVCDIWDYSANYAAGVLKAYKMPINKYSDINEMLAKEKNLDAVIVATPDFYHAEHANACLKAGKHVYCEKEMSNTVEGAKSMVETARTTGKLLQIGHQRRSNPRYMQALNLITKEKAIGRITNFMGQWNRGVQEPLGWPTGQEVPADVLKKYGYDTMERFRNWRWYKQYSGGAIADLGSHQIDIFSWFMGSNPVAVTGSGGLDYYKNREWYDNVLAIYEYQNAAGPARGFYQVLNTTSYGGAYEVIMGDEGYIEIAEDGKRNALVKEVTAPKKDWENKVDKIKNMDVDAIEIMARDSFINGAGDAEKAKIKANMTKPPHQLHLENFFDSIRGNAKLNCPSEIAFETCVAVLRVNDSIAASKRMTFAPADFKA